MQSFIFYLERRKEHRGGLRDYYKIKYKVEVGCYTYGGCFGRNFNQEGKRW